MVDGQDLLDLERAVQLLEFPTFTSRVTRYLGKPMERMVGMLPASVLDKLSQYTHACLSAALRVVLLTVGTENRRHKANDIVLKGLVVATGAAGGFFGGLTMAAELPVSTGIMMRSIAEVAREEGEDLSSVESRLACLSVLGLDTSTDGEVPGLHAAKYFFARNAMAAELVKSTQFVAANVVTDETAPLVVKMLNKVAERFGVQLTEKMAADLVPVVGAVSGATINYLFIDHFQRIARGHFIVRRLERTYGRETVREAYEAVLSRMLRFGPRNFDELEEVAATRQR